MYSYLKNKAIRRGALLFLFSLLLILFLPLIQSIDLAERDSLMAAEEVVKDTGDNVQNQVMAYPPAPKLKEEDYPHFLGINSRIFIWLVAQLHLWFGAFVLAVPIFVLVIELIGVFTRDERYDKMAYEFIKISVTAYSFTALFGGLLLFGFIIFYPDFFRYLSGLFGPLMLVYAFLFFGESAALYLYYYGWGAMKKGGKKWVHLFLGLLLNTFGTALMILANSVTGFMMAPSGVDASGVFQGNLWEVIHNPLWNPLNLHRFIANLAYGGSIVGAYAAYRFLSATTEEDKAHYDWMGYTANFIAISALLPLPFAGYWFTAEMYAYSQQMGITLMGGIFAWMFIIQAVIIGALFLSANFYLWCGMGRIKGSERYTGYIKYLAFVIVLSFLVWFTPHTMIMTPKELKALGGVYHPYLGPLGVMPAKNTAVNLMIIFTFLSFMIYRRSNKEPVVSWARYGNIIMVAFFLVAIINIISLGIGGYLVPANIKVGQSVPQVFSTLSVIVFAIIMDSFIYKGAKTFGPIEWGNMPPRSQYALFLIAVSFTWLMGLMGYIRSAIRQHWHVYTVMRDNSPDAFTPTIGYAANVVTIGTLIFMAIVIFIFWLNQLSSKKEI